MGIVAGECWVARANWDRVEVRDERGTLRFAHEVAPALSNGLLDEMLFVGGHLASAIGSGIMSDGFCVWEMPSGTTVLDVSGESLDGRYLLSSPPGSSTLLVADPEGVAVWDVTTRERARLVRVCEPDSAVLDPESGRVACGAWRRVSVYDGKGSELSSWSFDGGDIDELVWGNRGRLLVGVPVGRQAHVWDAEDGSLLCRLDVRGEILASSPCGRWMVLDDGLVDLEDLSVHALTAGAAAFDPGARAFVLADRDRTWRVAL